MRTLTCELSKERRTPTTTRSRCLCGLSRRSAAAHMLRLWVRIPPGAWMFVCCECCVLSGGGFCVELITRPEESYRVWSVVVCDLETSWMSRPWPTGGCCAENKNTTRQIENVLYLTMLSTAKIIPSSAKIILYFIESRGFCATLNNTT